MRNNQSNIEDDSLLEEYRRYLLNEMDKEEAEGFEHRLFMELDLPVEALDEDLLAACARKEFPPEQERQILHRLSSVPNGPDRALVQDITKLANQAQPQPWARLVPFPLRAWTRRHPYLLKNAAAAALLVAVGVPAWISMQPEPPPVIFPLALDTVRGSGTISQLKVSSETERIEIQVDVAGEKYPSYKLELTDVKSGEEVTEEISQGGGVLTLELDASDLPEGEYELSVYGNGANGAPELLGAPGFEVLQSD